MDKGTKWYKKWWVWTIAIVVVLFILGVAVGRKDHDASNNEQNTEAETVEVVEENSSDSSENTSSELTEAEKSNTLPEITPSDYIGQEALLVYHELNDQGYEIELDYADKDNEILYQNNMALIEEIKSLDPNSAEDRQSVDAYSVYNIVQLGDHLTIIVK